MLEGDNCYRKENVKQVCERKDGHMFLATLIPLLLYQDFPRWPAWPWECGRAMFWEFQGKIRKVSASFWICWNILSGSLELHVGKVMWRCSGQLSSWSQPSSYPRQDTSNGKKLWGLSRPAHHQLNMTKWPELMCVKHNNCPAKRDKNFWPVKSWDTIKWLLFEATKFGGDLLLSNR